MTTNTRGGTRPGAGRKPVADTPTKRYNVTLDDKTAKTVREYGDGNLSEGIRRAGKLINSLHKTVL